MLVLRLSERTFLSRFRFSRPAANTSFRDSVVIAVPELLRPLLLMLPSLSFELDRERTLFLTCPGELPLPPP
jgi:hypothetical protein